MDPIIGITILLAAALVGGLIAVRLKQPIIVGYLVVGVVAGPYALGIFTDTEMIETAATIGVSLLMFTLGLELSLGNLKIGKIGLWGSLAQILGTTALGAVTAYFLFKWTIPQSLLFGFIIYSASSAMLLKVLMDRGELDSVHGRIVIAIAIAQDIAAVILILILPFLGQSPDSIFPDVFISIGKMVAFILGAIIFGLWVLPWILGRFGKFSQRELFLLTVLVLAMGAAISTYEFGLPAVFGAFLIGFILRRMRYTNQAMAEITPFKDVFVAIFFVSMGMLLDLGYVVQNWHTLIIMVPLIVFWKFAVVFMITWFFGYGKRVAILTGVAMFHIGEFGFIIAQTGLSSEIISHEMYSVVIASAIITMLIMPSSMSLVTWLYKKLNRPVEAFDRRTALGKNHDNAPLDNPIIIAGFGRTGQSIAVGIQKADITFTVIELDPERLISLRKTSIDHIYGDSSNTFILSQAGITRARILVITYPDQLAVENTARNALRLNPEIKIIARVHREQDFDLCRQIGVTELINPEYEASYEFIKRSLTHYGLSEREVNRVIRSTFEREVLPDADLDEKDGSGKKDDNQYRLF